MSDTAPQRLDGVTRVLVVDESVVARRLLRELLSAVPDLEVVGTAATTAVALDKLARLRPDVMTLDVGTDGLDGLAVLAAVRDTDLHTRTVMFATTTERGAGVTLDALHLGAADYATKPTADLDAATAWAQVRAELVSKIRAVGVERPALDIPIAQQPRTPIAHSAHVDIVAIGASTGGPSAVTAVLGSLPTDLGAPIVVVQHLPEDFSDSIVRRLDASVAAIVVEAEAGMVLEPGVVYVARGGRHLLVERHGTEGVLRCSDEPPENSCRPSVDCLFRSIATAYGDRSLGVVLTGMGQDGAIGAEWIKEAGGQIIVQDEATSVVWGMPGAIARAGLADAVLPLGEIGTAVRRRARSRASARIQHPTVRAT